MNLKLRKLNELGSLSRGRSRHRPRDAAFLYGGNHPFIQTGDVKASGLYIREWTQTYSDAGLAQSKKWPVGTMCITIAANIAETGILDFEACFPDSVIGFIADSTEADTRFVKYLFDFSLKRKFQTFSQGAAQDNLSQEKLLSIEFPVPDVDSQIAIADILARYDALIENNERRIRLLEEAARLIYREWFVRLRFPGHELTKIENGIPEGWSERPIEGALESHIGGGWGQDDPLEQEIEPAYVIRGTDFSALAQGEFGKVGLRYHKPGPLTKRILSAGDIIFEVSGGSATQPIARTVYMTDRLISAFNAPIICASFCKKFRPLSPELGLYLHLTFKEDRENGKLLIYQKQSASALLNFNFEAFLSGYRVRVPSESVLNEFYQAVFPLLDHCTVLAMQNKKLSQARDLLLPRLMSGEIEV